MDNSRSNHKEDNKIKKIKYIFDNSVGAGSFGVVFKVIFSLIKYKFIYIN